MVDTVSEWLIDECRLEDDGKYQYVYYPNEIIYTPGDVPLEMEEPWDIGVEGVMTNLVNRRLEEEGADFRVHFTVDESEGNLLVKKISLKKVGKERGGLLNI
jgi:hypothetical protein